MEAETHRQTKVTNSVPSSGGSESPGSLPGAGQAFLAQAGGVRDAATPSDQLWITAAGQEAGGQPACEKHAGLTLPKSGDNVFKINLLNDITIALRCLECYMTEMQ